MNKEIKSLGNLIQKQRALNGYSQKLVADKLGIDISLLSKIENGERQVQSRMLKPLAKLFKLSYKELQIKFLNQKIKNEFGNEPFIEEAVSQFLIERTK